jgi:membrane-associated phospholipid phosphatase
VIAIGQSRVLARIACAAWVAAGALQPAAAAGQALAPRDDYHAIRWYEPLAAAGALALVSLVDEPVADHFREHHSAAGDDLASAARHVGAPEVYLPVTAGVLVWGVAAHDPDVRHAGIRLAASLALAAAAAEGLKFALGRERPGVAADAYRFDPFTFDGGFPSGHATMAFAMAASLADDIDRGWATAGLYAAATAVAASRVYDREHWVSDVAGGALAGVAAAKLASGRWRVFGIRPPGFLLAGGRPGLGWRLAVRE